MPSSPAFCSDSLFSPVACGTHSVQEAPVRGHLKDSLICIFGLQNIMSPKTNTKGFTLALLVCQNLPVLVVVMKP